MRPWYLTSQRAPTSSTCRKQATDRGLRRAPAAVFAASVTKTCPNKRRALCVRHAPARRLQRFEQTRPSHSPPPLQPPATVLETVRPPTYHSWVRPRSYPTVLNSLSSLRSADLDMDTQQCLNTWPCSTEAQQRCTASCQRSMEGAQCSPLRGGTGAGRAHGGLGKIQQSRPVHRALRALSDHPAPFPTVRLSRRPSRRGAAGTFLATNGQPCSIALSLPIPKNFGVATDGATLNDGHGHGRLSNVRCRERLPASS